MIRGKTMCRICGTEATALFVDVPMCHLCYDSYVDNNFLEFESQNGLGFEFDKRKEVEKCLSPSFGVKNFSTRPRQASRKHNLNQYQLKLWEE